MLKSLPSVLVVVTMLFALMGQALAYTSMPCDMSVNSHQAHQAYKTTEHSNMIHHEGMSHHQMNENSTSSEPCCEIDCVCAANACTSVTFLNSETALTDILSLSDSVTMQHTEQTNAIFTSLFRPPIFA